MSAKVNVRILATKANGAGDGLVVFGRGFAGGRCARGKPEGGGCSGAGGVAVAQEEGGEGRRGAAQGVHDLDHG